MIQGACLGWSIVSELPFSFLRAGEGQDVLAVTEWDPGEDPSRGGELLVRWRPRPDRPFHGSVHRMPSGELVIETSDSGWFRLWPDEGRVEIPIGVDTVAREVRLLTTPMLLLATLNRRTPFHAACVDINGRAVALSAPGGFGKTTLAAGLVGRGHRILAEDITVLDDAGMVLPGPDLLRIRPDVFSRMETDAQLEVVHRTRDRVMVRTGGLESRPVALAAIVFLKVEDSTTVRKRFDPQRLADLWQVSFHMPNMTDRRRAFDAISMVADSVPIFDLGRPLTWDSMEWSIRTIEELAH